MSLLTEQRLLFTWLTCYMSDLVSNFNCNPQTLFYLKFVSHVHEMLLIFNIDFWTVWIAYNFSWLLEFVTNRQGKYGNCIIKRRVHNDGNTAPYSWIPSLRSLCHMLCWKTTTMWNGFMVSAVPLMCPIDMLSSCFISNWLVPLRGWRIFTEL